MDEAEESKPPGSQSGYEGGATIADLVRVSTAQRAENVRLIRERRPVDLEANLSRSITILRQRFDTLHPGESFDDVRKRFAEYFEDHLFDQIVHKSVRAFDEQVVLKSPVYLAGDMGQEVDKVKVQSGQLDSEIGNTNYVFANCLRLPSYSFQLADTAPGCVKGQYTVYQIKSETGYAAAVDYSAIPICMEGAYARFGDVRKGEQPIIDNMKLHYFARNLFTMEGVKDYFAAYTATLFSDPEEAVSFFAVFHEFLRLPGFLNGREDFLRQFGDVRYRQLMLIKDFMNESELVPPFVPEFQYKDSVVGKKIPTPK